MGLGLRSRVAALEYRPRPSRSHQPNEGQRFTEDIDLRRGSVLIRRLFGVRRHGPIRRRYDTLSPQTETPTRMGVSRRRVGGCVSRC